MKAEIKIAALVNSKDAPCLIARIRTEHDVIISPDTLSTVESVINQLADDKELVKQDGSHFAWELRQLIDIFKQYSESPKSVVGHLESGWKSVTGYLTLDTLKNLDDSTKNIKSMRIKGTPDTGLKLVIQSGLDIIEIPADRTRLLAIQAELESSKELPEFKANAAITDWIVAVAALIAVGLEIWDRWDKEQEKKRERKEKERREEKEERLDRERTCREPRETSEGGPAHDGLVDRISRTA
ncbi:MAG: hypothetical protein E6Q94_00395 [Burkholderiaceae bacterium]|jgi:hypothetical protein|nr:MAG: hypothetical protein E6Q94_00395 [Burkholderiaceae bacterium]